MIETVLLMIFIGIFAGIAGAILGLGGGIIVTPILTLLCHLDIKYAIGASIVVVIATSSGSTIAYLKDEVLNLRVAMFLEIATTIGALSGALLTGILEPKYLYILFGLLILFSAFNMVKKLMNKNKSNLSTKDDKLAKKLRLNSSYYDKAEHKQVDYRVENIPGGLSVMFGDGLADRKSVV